MIVTIKRKVKSGGLGPTNMPYVNMEEKLEEYLNSDDNYICKPSLTRKSPNNMSISNRDVLGRVVKINEDSIECDVNSKEMKYIKLLSNPVIHILSNGYIDDSKIYVDKIINLIVKSGF